MAILTTTRLGIKRWESGADAFTRSDMDESHAQLEARVVGFDNGGSQPTASAAKAGFFHYTTTDSAVGQLSYCNGTSYFDIAAPGTISSLDGALSDGTATTFARSDHTHSLDAGIVTTTVLNDSAVTTAKINNSAVTTDKINANAVTNAKLGSDLDASKLTAGTLPVARLAAGSILNAKLGSDLDASKLTAGTLPIARIADNAVTVSKIEQVLGHGILARVDSTTGNLSELTASTNQVLGRGASGNLTFAQVSTGQIATGAVTDAKLGSDLDASKLTAGTLPTARIAANSIDNTRITHMGANTVKVRNVASTGDPSDLEIGSDRVLGRDGSNNLSSTQIKTAMIAADAVTSGKIADNAVTLGTQTTGNYVATITGSTSITVTGSGSESAGVTISHSDTSTLNGAYGGNNNGIVIEDITVDGRGHVTAIGTRDLDDRFPPKGSSYTNSTGGGYWVTYGTGNPPSDSAPNGSIYLQYS
jgi:hypothetical protein